MTVLLHVGAASGGVGDDRVYICAFEGVDGFARQQDGGGFLAGVNEERAAAGLILRRDDFAAFCRKHADRSGVYLGKKFALDTLEKQTDATPLGALGWSDARDEFAGA